MLDGSVVRVVRFGDFELDVRAGELRKCGVPLNLPEQPFQLLVALLERPGQIISRDELRQRLWSSDTFVDFDHGLNAAVKRNGLGDSAETPRFVETVPRRGYRFIAAVEVDGQTTSVATSSMPRREARLLWLAAAVAALAIITLPAARKLWGTTSSIHTEPGPPMRLVQVTSMRGVEAEASFAPDGNSIAFGYGRENDRADMFSQNWCVYVMNLQTGETARLGPDHRTDRVVDGYPSWSPDGQHIAFVRAVAPRAGESLTQRIYVMTAFGAAISKVSDFPVSSGE